MLQSTRACRHDEMEPEEIRVSPPVWQRVQRTAQSTLFIIWSKPRMSK